MECPSGQYRTEEQREAVRALSWLELDAVRSQLDALVPYNRSIVKDGLFKLEDDNFEDGARKELWFFGLSSKRYCLFRRDEDGDARLLTKCDDEGTIEFIGAMQHGLGAYMSPTPNDNARGKTWIAVFWEMKLAEYGLRPPRPEPRWFRLPALTQYNVSSPEMLRCFPADSFGANMRPFTFVSVAHETIKAAQSFWAAPFDRDPEHWASLPWVNLYCHDTANDVPPSFRTIGGVYRIWGGGDEAKLCDPRTGRSAGPESRGSLEHFTFRPQVVVCIGKEGRFAQVAGESDPAAFEESIALYGSSKHGMLPAIRELLSGTPVRRLSVRANLSERAMRSIQAGNSVPTERTMNALVAIAAEIARRRIAQVRSDSCLGSDEDVIMAYFNCREERDRLLSIAAPMLAEVDSCEAAHALGITPGAVKRLVRGERRVCDETFDVLLRIAAGSSSRFSAFEPPLVVCASLVRAHHVRKTA